jgi:hypothetical protein
MILIYISDQNFHLNFSELIFSKKTENKRGEITLYEKLPSHFKNDRIYNFSEGK